MQKTCKTHNADAINNIISSITTDYSFHEYMKYKIRTTNKTMKKISFWNNMSS